ncbi:type IV toxin-antitoxin system AbiEi family antitoxin [Rhodococcus sp. NPDC003318]|uniref:type IV toxin-antitoxin system AbiEi family antitoxin domain-containing protein n=1 Tax=Rhodococcus sp. NPDC003318 TaxID=3364503 RepID=UPI003674A591
MDVTPERKRRDHDLRARAEVQDGYFTAAQARACGFSAEEMADAVVSGTWAQPDLGLFRLSPWRAGDLDEVARCCVRLDGAVVSHQSAAELHGLGHLHPSFLHVTAPDETHLRLDRVAVHHCDLAAEDTEHTGAFLITTPLRTVLDLADGGVSQWVLDEVVGDALAIGRLDRDELEAGCDESSTRVRQRVRRALSAWA